MRYALMWVVIASVTVRSPDVRRPVDTESMCEAERKEFHESSLAVRGQGSQTRERLLGVLEQILETHRESAPICTGRLTENKAYLLILDGRLQEADRVIERYLASPSISDPMPGNRGVSESRVMLYIQRGYVLSEIGETVEGARSYYEAASRAFTVPAHVGSRALAEAASTARILGDHAASSDYIDATLQLIADSASTNKRLGASLGLVLTSRAILTEQMMEGQPGDSLWHQEARSLLTHSDRALDALSNEGQSEGFRAVALSLRALALAMDDRFEAANAAIATAHASAARVGSMLPVALHAVWMMESRVCSLQGNADCARQSASRAIEDALSRSDLEGEAAAIERLASVEENVENWEVALELYKQAVQRQEVYRDRLGLQDWSTSAFAKVQHPYRGLVRVYLAMGQTEKAFAALDATRARYLQDLTQHHSIRRALDDRKRGIVDSLSSRLVEARMELYREQMLDQRSAWTSRISRLQSELEAITGTRRGDPGLEVGALQRRLAEDSRTLVTYAVDAEGSTVFVVRPDTVVPVPLRVSPRELADGLERIGSPWRDDVEADPKFSLSALHSLYQTLWRPIEHLLETSSILLIPDATTSTVPFAALTSEPATDYEFARYLVKDYSIGYDVSASLAARSTTSNQDRTTALLMGREAFDGSMWNTRLPTLEHVADELRGAQKAIGGVKLLGESATETEFYERARTASVVHLASHAEANATFPLSSKIELGSDASTDGTLHLYEIMETTLNADLVVLSGCSTGKGRAIQGEGMVGLQYGMRAAGASSAVATLWPLSDKASATLMTSFYQALANGDSKDRAMRKAQLYYIESNAGIQASPFFWAAPVLSGDMAPLREQLSVWWKVVGAALMAGLVGIAWSLYRTQRNVRLQRPV